MEVKLRDGRTIPVEEHRIKVVQKSFLLPAEKRLERMREGGFNTFSLRSSDVFIDMLTDSGTNAISDNQLASWMRADDAYAGSESFFRMEASARRVFGKEFVLPVHQGRAAEHIISKLLVKPGSIVPTNFHFTTSRAHVEILGGKMVEVFPDETLKTKSSDSFKGNADIGRMRAALEESRGKVAFVRMECSANLPGGQPFSLDNLRKVKELCVAEKVPLVIDASLIGENAFFIKKREEGQDKRTVAEIVREIGELSDIIYLSARKSSSSKGGLLLTGDRDFFLQAKTLLPLFEGFLTYGGMPTSEVESIAVGISEMTDENVCSASPEQVAFLVRKLELMGVPVVTPPGALGAQIDAREFLRHVPQKNYPAGALAAALFIAGGIRGMERGTISEDRDPKTGAERLAKMELLRLAIPRRRLTLSHLEFVADRVGWLFDNRELVGGLEFVEEPEVLRFFFGKLRTIGGWEEELAKRAGRELS